MSEPDKRTPWICANCGIVFGDEQGAAIVAGLRAANAELTAALKEALRFLGGDAGNSGICDPIRAALRKDAAL